MRGSAPAALNAASVHSRAASTSGTCGSARSAPMSDSIDDHGAARAQCLELAAQDLLAVGQVEQQQARDDGVERLARAERPRVRLEESDPFGARGRAPLLGDLEQPLRLVDAHHRPARIEQAGHLKATWPRPVPRSSTRMATADPGRAQQRLRGPRDRARLGVEPRDLRVVGSEHVCGLLAHHGSLSRERPSSPRTAGGATHRDPLQLTATRARRDRDGRHVRLRRARRRPVQAPARSARGLSRSVEAAASRSAPRDAEDRPPLFRGASGAPVGSPTRRQTTVALTLRRRAAAHEPGAGAAVAKE